MPGVKTDGVKTVLFNVRVSLQELEVWRAAAAGEGVSVSEWVRGRCAGSFGPVVVLDRDGSRRETVSELRSVLAKRFG